MIDVSRRTFVIGTTAGLALSLPDRASTASVNPAFERLSRAIEGEVGVLAAEPVKAVGRVQDHLRSAAEAGAFDPWRDEAITANSKLTLVSGGAPGRTWKVQLFRIAAGRSHPPHCHENLASCQVVLDGRIHVREYERLRDRETEEFAMLQSVFDGELGPGQAILTSEDHRNAHWFGAVGGPALVINFKASGQFRREFLRLRNRRYLDPLDERDGPFPAPFITSAEAKARFATRGL